uniref:Uncharacterized protein n=1 Tax=Corethron hystrix TaxID=216773 RepID=A0A7S1FXT8_9STRA
MNIFSHTKYYRQNSSPQLHRLASRRKTVDQPVPPISSRRGNRPQPAMRLLLRRRLFLCPLLLLLALACRAAAQSCSEIQLCGMSVSARLSGVVAAAQAVVGSRAFQNPNSAYSRALVWIRDHDRIW